MNGRRLGDETSAQHVAVVAHHADNTQSAAAPRLLDTGRGEQSEQSGRRVRTAAAHADVDLDGDADAAAERGEEIAAPLDEPGEGPERAAG
jgi:hypothetical protein